MQVLSRQRGVSLIQPHKRANAGGSRFDRVAAVGGRSRHVDGFTVVELMITVVIAVVLIMIAVPSFKSITLSSKLTTTANDLVLAINSARMEAVKRNAKTQLCSNSASVNTSDTLGNACATQTGAVYVLVGGSPATAATVLAGIPGLAAPIQLSGNVQALRFNGQGLAYAATATAPYNGKVADICTSQMSSNNHRVITMTAGSILATTNGPPGVSCP